MDAAAIRLALRKLAVTGSALYVGAHPDDENSAMIAWLSQGRLVRTAYLSLTRGDGGQDLIGPDVGEPLGVIRTQELLDARRIDGGEQLFTRAVDFGFSKNPDETFQHWPRDTILADAVWAIRRFRPDVIIERFATDGSGGHGHHTASALLAEDAFDAAADSTRFPEQLQWVRPWRAKRLVWNVSRPAQAAPDTTSGRIRIDLGALNPELGLSYTEIAGLSRSMHKSQGVGAPQRRGAAVNSFEPRRGERATSDLFDGVDLTWGRYPAGRTIMALLAHAERVFNPDHPEELVPELLDVRRAMAKLPDDPIVARRREELDALIRACSGLWIEALASRHSVVPGGTMRIAVSAIVRSTMATRVTAIDVVAPATATHAEVALATRTPQWTLAPNQTRTDTIPIEVPDALPPQGPYWLGPRASAAVFPVPDPRVIGMPENAPQFTARVHTEIAGQPLTFEIPVVHRWVDPVEGDRYRDVGVVPPAALRFDRATYVFPDRSARDVRVSAMATDRPLEGALALTLPAGWRSEPPSMWLTLRGAEAETTVTFHVTPGAAPAAATMGVALRAGGATYTQQLVRIDHPHIPIQTLLPPATANLVRADIAHRGAVAGYVMGSGDAVDDALEQIGYRVQRLTDDDLARLDLSRFDVLVIGVRAFNTRPRLVDLVPRMLDAVQRGTRLVVQYQTPDRALDNRLGPWPFTVSSDRVTVEQAEMRPLPGAGAALLRSPNVIGPPDFEGWVQERGLSFANPADPRYARVLSSNDPGEPPKDGGVLYTRYGRGAYVYTGLALFRQLPAGVPGAYRLLANLVSPERGDDGRAAARRGR